MAQAESEDGGAMGEYDIQYEGKYRPAAGSRAFNEEFWTSDVMLNGKKHRVVDAAGLNPDGRNVVRLIPYGPGGGNEGDLICDGDLLAYIRDRNVISLGSNIDALLPLLKGRASHAELGYHTKEKGACHISLWDARNPIRPTDCKTLYDHADNAAIGIYRISLKEYGVDLAREAKLKAEVHKWKEIVRPVNFPNGFALNLDPVDFTSVESLGKIARKFLQHAPSDPRPPVEFRLNCVQWSTLVLSLAICFPLTKETVEMLGARKEFDAYWSAVVGGYCEDGVVGLGELPIPFYSPMDVVENALDLYLPAEKSFVLELAGKYPVGDVLRSKGLGIDHRVVMPSTFILENRLRNLGVARRTKTVFEYVATALPERELVKV